VKLGEGTARLRLDILAQQHAVAGERRDGGGKSSLNESECPFDLFKPETLNFGRDG
jgi:hypothetical protein